METIPPIPTALTTLKTPEIEECQRLANWGLNWARRDIPIPIIKYEK